MLVSPFNVLGLQFRAPSNDLTVGETITLQSFENGNLAKFKTALITLGITNLQTADYDDGEVSFFIQTTYDKGDTWEDLACVSFDDADDGTEPVVLVAIGPGAVGVSVLAHSDQELAPNTTRDLPLGSAIQIVLVLDGTPTVAYSAHISLYG